MTKTVRLVEKRDWKALSDKFALMIDGWSEMGSSTHYVCVDAFLQAKQVRQSTFYGFCASVGRNFIHRRQPFGSATIRFECLRKVY